MRKTLSLIVLFTFCLGLAMPALIKAQPKTLPEKCTITHSAVKGQSVGGETCPDGECLFTLSQCGMCCLLQTIYNVTDWIFYLLMIAVVLMFVIAAFLFLTAGGDMGKTKNAQGMIILSVVALVVALIAKLIPSVVKMIIGM